MTHQMTILPDKHGGVSILQFFFSEAVYRTIFAKIKLSHPRPKRQEKSEPRKTISCIIKEKDTQEENRSGNNSGNLRRNQTVP